MFTFIQDLTYGARMLRKRPGFTAMAVLTLALGIGINTGIFTLFEAQLRPLPIRDPGTVVRLEYRPSNRGGNFSFPDYHHYRDQTQVLSGLIAHTPDKFLVGERDPAAELDEVAGEFVSDDFFSPCCWQLSASTA